jgi:hypothetical protein
MNRGTLWTIPFVIPVIIEGAVGHYVIITVVTWYHHPCIVILTYAYVYHVMFTDVLNLHIGHPSDEGYTGGQFES